LTSTALREGGCCRTIARKVFTIRPQRAAAAWMRAARCRTASSGAVASSMVVCATTTASGLFSSCATPASRLPSALIFSLWCSLSRCRATSACACRSGVRSRSQAVKKLRPAALTSWIDSSQGKTEPSARIASSSSRWPSTCGQPVAW
jgi:hypothetical protein